MSDFKYHGHLGHNHYNPRPLGLFQGIDFNDGKGTQVRAATSPKPRRTGWYVVPGLGHTGHGPTLDQFIEQERKRIQARNKERRSYLYPQVGKIGNHFWYWKCRQCEQLQFAANWGAAYQAATHHAHNHHRSQK